VVSSGLRTRLIVLLLISSITAYDSTQSQAKDNPRKQVSSGEYSGKLLYQGWLRTYYLHIPKSYKSDHPTPLVLVLHGSGGSGSSIANVTHFNQLADKKGFIVVYPNGINHHWSDSHSVFSPQVDDISFVTALLDHLMKLRNIDSRRIYATGFSNGGMLTQTLACQLSDRIAAFASVAGTLPANLASSCKPKTPVSLLMFNGTSDRSVPYAGGKIAGVGREVLSVYKTVQLWRHYNGCASKAKVEKLPNTIRSSGNQVEISRYLVCSGGSEVMLVTVKGGGHSWPGASENVKDYQGNASKINASAAIWNFFQRHVLHSGNKA